MGAEDVRNGLATAMSGSGGALAAADRLCRACVDLLKVDGASISIVDRITTRGTFGSSGDLSRRVDEYQFTFGEGPCIDAVRNGAPVLIADLSASSGDRWPAFSAAVLESGIQAVFALPVAVASTAVGALDLFNRRTGPLSDAALTGGLLAAELAALPLLDVMNSRASLDGHAESEYGWDELASLQRVEVYQATGMLIDALDVDPTEALVRLRASAFSRGMTASELAWEIVERRVDLHDDRRWRSSDPEGGADHGG